MLTIKEKELKSIKVKIEKMNRKVKEKISGLRDIDSFMSSELKSIKREFKEAGLGEFGITNFKEKNGNYHFIANKKIADKISKEELAEGISKDPFHAKAKMIRKLREVLKVIKCQIKNPLHKRETQISSIY